MLKNNSLINVYVTLRADLASGFLNSKEKLTIGNVDDGYTVIKLLEKVRILEAFDIDGTKIEDSESNIIDTVIIAVTPEEAKIINLLRELGNFNIVEINEEEKIDLNNIEV